MTEHFSVRSTLNIYESSIISVDGLNTHLPFKTICYQIKTIRRIKQYHHDSAILFVDIAIVEKKRNKKQVK